MCTSEITNQLRFAWSQTFDVFCDRLALYREMIDADGIGVMLRTCYKDLDRLEKAKVCTDTANRLYLLYQMFINISILANIAPDGDLSRFGTEKVQRIYRNTTKAILGQITPSDGEALCDLPLEQFDDLLRLADDNLKRAEYALVGVVRAYRLYNLVVKKYGMETNSKL